MAAIPRFLDELDLEVNAGLERIMDGPDRKKWEESGPCLVVTIAWHEHELDFHKTDIELLDDMPALRHDDGSVERRVLGASPVVVEPAKAIERSICSVRSTGAPKSVTRLQPLLGRQHT